MRRTVDALCQAGGDDKAASCQFGGKRLCVFKPLRGRRAAADDRQLRQAQQFRIALIVAPAAFAHSLEDLESMLGAKEKFFQPVDKEAPDSSEERREGKEGVRTCRSRWSPVP